MSQDRTMINCESTITFPNEACAVTCTWKVYLWLMLHFKNKKQNAFATTLLPFQVALLAIVKNDLIIA